MQEPLPIDAPSLKRCAMCKQTKPLSEFNVHRGRKDGLQPQCRECSRARSRRYYAENRDKHLEVIRARRARERATNQDLMLAFLATRACVDCGETDVCVLEFDHLRDKTCNVSTMVHRGVRWALIVEEIAKCEVVCANCHRRRTHARQNSYRVRAPDP